MNQRIRTLVRMILVAAVIIPATLDASVLQAQTADDNITEFDSIETGLLFLNGDFLPAPYELQTSASRVIVNGQPFNIEPIANTEEFDEEQENRERRRGAGGFRPGQRRFGGNRRGVASESPGDGPHSRSRERAWSVDDQAATIADCLNADEIVVLFDGQPLRSLSFASQQYHFLQGVADPDLANQPLEDVVDMTLSPEERVLWTQWLQNLPQSEELNGQIRRRMDFIEKAEARGMSQIAATARLEKLSYPLTIVGMLMGVYAFGHMLQWIGRGLGGDNAGSQESQRFVVVALGLMFGMSLLDVLWTVLAGQAGAMRELNPIAAQFIDSPMKLALFKAAATAVGFSILYGWRHRGQIQHATWWMCLVCVLLTFRWVMFDSMMN